MRGVAQIPASFQSVYSINSHVCLETLIDEQNYMMKAIYHALGFPMARVIVTTVAPLVKLHSPYCDGQEWVSKRVSQSQVGLTALMCDRMMG